MYYDSKRRPDGSLPDWAAQLRAELDGRDNPHPLPLEFLARINLADLPAAPDIGLPGRGLLYFFYREDVPLGGVSNERDLLRVIHADVPAGELAPAEYPGPPPRRSLRPCRLEFILEMMLPFAAQTEFDHLEGYRPLLGRLLAGLGGTNQRIGGYPYPIQEDVFHEINETDRLTAGAVRSSPDEPDEMSYAEYERAETERAAAAAAMRWRLLLQLDMDENVGWGWGDAGRLYFLIGEDGLRDRRFDGAEVVIQSH